MPQRLLPRLFFALLFIAISALSTGANAQFGQKSSAAPSSVVTTPYVRAELLAHLPAATEDEATELATQRGQAVKAYLAEQKLPEERLFIAAPKAAKPDEKWTPQAQLNLATQ